MANYTIVLSDVLRQIILDTKYTSLEQADIQFDYNKLYEYNPIELVRLARPLLFNFNYELFDVNHKETLETKFLYHYFNYEIGQETIGAFKFSLQRAFINKLPYYNKLYEAYAEKFDIFNNIDYIENITGEAKNKTQQQSNSNLQSDTEDTQYNDYYDDLRQSDTPQDALQDVRDGKYISKYDYNSGGETVEKNNRLSSNSNIDTQSSGESDNKSDRVVKGTNTRLTKSKMLEDYLKVIKDVDMMFIEDLKTLFMLLW